MAGRFANRGSGVWSADCTLALDRDSSLSSDRIDVVLTSVGDDQIAVIKVVREVTGLGLRDAKDLVDRAPVTIKSGISIGEARNIATVLESAGATANVVAKE
jgi:large subunit ribosomal protein L7/L12